jgi:hypothetical protein
MPPLPAQPCPGFTADMVGRHKSMSSQALAEFSGGFVFWIPLIEDGNKK